MSTTPTLTCYLLAAGLCHAATIFLLPYIIMHVVMRKMRERLTAAAAGTALGGTNQSQAAARTLSHTARCDARGAFVFAHAPLPDHEARTIVCPSPDLLYSPICYDLSVEPHILVLRMACGPTYSSVSFFDPSTTNFAVLNTQHLKLGQTQTVLLAGPKADRARVLRLASALGRASVTVHANFERGFALQRMFAPATPGSVEHAATVAYQRALLVVSPLPSVVLALATDRATSSLVAELSAPLSVDAALVDVAERISECAKPATAVSIADLQSDIDASTRAAPSPFHLKSLIAAWWLVLFTACAPFIFAAHADGFLASQLVALGAACLLGAISTLLFVVAIRATGSASLANGAWSTLRSIGGPASNIWTKALVAVFGLMALSHKEAIYLSATHDSSGRPLSTGRRYRVVVPPSLPAAWWSLTVYDSMRYLVPNALGRYSINSASASAPAASSNPLDRSVALSVDPRPTDDASAQWISLGLAGRAPAKFVLMLRLYRPQFQLERLGELALPHIVAEED